MIFSRACPQQRDSQFADAQRITHSLRKLHSHHFISSCTCIFSLSTHHASPSQIFESLTCYESLPRICSSLTDCASCTRTFISHSLRTRHAHLLITHALRKLHSHLLPCKMHRTIFCTQDKRHPAWINIPKKSDDHLVQMLHAFICDMKILYDLTPLSFDHDTKNRYNLSPLGRKHPLSQRRVCTPHPRRERPPSQIPRHAWSWVLSLPRALPRGLGGTLRPNAQRAACEVL